MSVLSDKWIKKIAKTKGMIVFVGKQVGKAFSVSHGYDARVSNEFKILLTLIQE